MRTLLSITCLVLICSFLPTTSLLAQEEENQPVYFVTGYMKVDPGMDGKYLKLEKAWKKIHAASIEAGHHDGWMLQRVLSPYGANTEYNYITVNRFVGDKKLAAFFEQSNMGNIEEILSPDELKLVEKTNKIRTMVKVEVWQHRNGTFAEDMSDASIYVFNYFKLKPGKTGPDHGKMEHEIWKPLHKARIDGGDMKGWGLYSMEMPSGSMMPYDNASVDFYKNMEQYLGPWSKDYWKEVHPDKKVDDLIKASQEVVDLLWTEVRQMIDSVGF